MPNIPYLPALCAGVALAVAIALLLRWQRARKKRREDQEQMLRKRREDALDRALSNQSHPAPQEGAQAPADIHYNAERAAEGDSGMLRLTEMGETVTKAYLLELDGPVYLGVEHEKAAVFRQKDPEHKIFAELFFYNGALYVRAVGGEGGMLTRGKRRAQLDTQGVKLQTNDMIETKYGSFLVELI